MRCDYLDEGRECRQNKTSALQCDDGGVVKLAAEDTVLDANAEALARYTGEQVKDRIEIFPNYSCFGATCDVQRVCPNGTAETKGLQCTEKDAGKETCGDAPRLDSTEMEFHGGLQVACESCNAGHALSRPVVQKELTFDEGVVVDWVEKDIESDPDPKYSALQLLRDPLQRRRRLPRGDCDSELKRIVGVPRCNTK